MKNLSIYIHIPFCESKCYYCNFVSCASKEHDKYFSALQKEISDFNAKNYIVKTIYIGGGTPSFVNTIFITNILKQIRSKFTVKENAEITIECNPNSMTIEKLKKYKDIGINRISFGVQSFNKKSLEFVGRIQGDKKKLSNYKKLVIENLKQAKKLGFDNLSADIILGLPYQKNRHIKKDIKTLSKLITHFSCYMLSIEKNTKLYNLLPQGVKENKLIKQYEVTVKTLKRLGFDRYEISNFSKMGFESRHNNVYWSMGNYVGFGVSAHSFIDEYRIANTDNMEEYVRFFDKNNSEIENGKEIRLIEKVSKEELGDETIMLALRTRKGLDLIMFKEKFYDLEKKKAKQLAFLLNNGFIKFKNNFLHLFDKGFLVSDAIILKIVS